jgi:ADP-ribosyl-[dinitrogen reductase] hydrolase
MRCMIDGGGDLLYAIHYLDTFLDTMRCDMEPDLSPLVAVAIGDAYALPFEYRPGNYDTWAHLNDGAHYERHPTFAATVPKGAFSDDTHQSLAIAEVMLKELFPSDDTMRVVTLAEEMLCDAFCRNPDAGYAKGMAQAFRTARETRRPLGEVCAAAGKRETSGAAMRATPLGLLPKLQDALDMAALLGGITHTGKALLAAQAAAGATHYMYYRLGPRRELGRWLNTTLGQCDWNEPWQGPVDSPGMDSVRAAVTTVMAAGDLRDLLVRCVAWTGDVDTVAAVAMGAAWGYGDLPNTLPEALWDQLEERVWYSKHLLRTTDVCLMERYPRPQGA